jgi:hypothetical protein
MFRSVARLIGGPKRARSEPAGRGSASAAEFWVYDVYASILFAQMADVIAETPKGQRPEWPTALKQLRVHAFLGANQYVHLDERCDGHEEEFLEILAEAVRRLAACGRITAKEAAAWIVCGRQPIIWRGEGFEETAPVIAFAESLDGSSAENTLSSRPDTAGSSAAAGSP